MATSLSNEYTIKPTKISTSPHKSDIERKLIHKYELLTTLRGCCGCPQCDPTLYNPVLPTFNPVRGLQYRKHDAWDLARIAVSSFGSELSLVQTQKLALHSWSAWLAAMNLPRAGTLDGYGLQIAIGMFSEIFFLGVLPPAKLVVNWDAQMPEGMLGQHLPAQRETGPETILLNCRHHKLQCSMFTTFSVLLHEMIHSYLSRYTCYPWHKVECATGRCGQLYSVHVGVTGHGRAFHYIAKSIEDNALRLLGIPLHLGRQCGTMTEHRRGGYTPCAKDLALLYNGPKYEHLWECLARTRDDDTVVTRRLLGVYGRPHTRDRRKSDPFLLRSPRRNWIDGE